MRKILLPLAAFLLLLSCRVPASSPPGPVYHSVQYSVTGSAAAVDLTYENASGGTSQTTGTLVPWTYSFSAVAGAFTFLYISAQNSGATGTVTATIYIDGSILQTSTSSGAYVIATASGVL